jgi:hypothetical protein
VRPALAVSLLLLAAAARADDLAARAARSYRLDPGAPLTLAPGEGGAVSVVIRCEPGVHLQRQAPLRVTAEASGGLALPRSRLGWGDVHGSGDAQEVEVPVSVKGVTPGAAEVRLRLDFFVCSQEWCARQEREVVLPVTVSAGPGPGAARAGGG